MSHALLLLEEKKSQQYHPIIQFMLFHYTKQTVNVIVLEEGPKIGILIISRWILTANYSLIGHVYISAWRRLVTYILHASFFIVSWLCHTFSMHLLGSTAFHLLAQFPESFWFSLTNALWKAFVISGLHCFSRSHLFNFYILLLKIMYIYIFSHYL